jgi:phage tail sheath protein FI
MAKLKFGSAGVTAREIDLTGPTTQEPIGIPAGIIGTSLKGPAFVPVTVGNLSDWTAKFGETDGKKFGPLAVREWLRNAQAVTYLKVLGTGDGKKRNDAGEVTNAGFTVGEQQPSDQATNLDALGANAYANAGGPLGRTYFLGCFMSESAGSKLFSEAGIQTSAAAIPIIRGVLMAPSGVIMRLSSTIPGAGLSSNGPSAALVATEANSAGTSLGTVVFSQNNAVKQDFVLILNGHKGTNSTYPNVITASFDVNSNNYFYDVLNTDPLRLQTAGHYLYAHWDIHGSLAVLTGSGVINAASGSGPIGGYEPSAFIISGSTARNAGSATAPDYENFNDRFAHAATPFFISQKFGGEAINLFKFHALDDGSSVSDKIKISIENINKSNDPLNKYGTFDVMLRLWDDRDLDKKVLVNEKYTGVTLDPTSDRYIAKVIGDLHAYYDFDRELSSQKLVIEGGYSNRSNYVRVEVNPDLENGYVDPLALPMGFRGINHLVTSGSAPLSTVTPAAVADIMSQVYSFGTGSYLKNSVTPPLPFRSKITTGEEWSVKELAEKGFYWGIQFEHPEGLTKRNSSVLANKSIESFAKYFPQFALGEARFITGSNAGQASTAANGILDSDVFCNNVFTLENIQVVTGSTGNADPEKWSKAVYVRNGAPAGGGYLADRIGATDSAKTRPFKIDDLADNKRYAKFTAIMQGGFNGVNIFDENEAEITNNAVVADMTVQYGRGLSNGPSVASYLKAIEIMKNTVNVDIQLLAIPGIREPLVTDTAIQATEERFDALFIMDIPHEDENGANVRDENDQPSVTNTINSFRDRSVDSSFAAAYFPDVLYSDPKGINLFVPPSVVVLGALSLNDAVGHPWFAPAGFTRGALPQEALEARVKLNQNDLDALYNNSINPLVAFPGAPRSGTNPASGLVVWGQKTLQVAASALDRVNVRRLLIEIRRQVRDIAQTIIFEPSREATLSRFSSAVTPRLQRIQALAGLERFKVVIDSSTTTQDDILNNTLRGKIFVQPTKTIEFVSLDFVVSNNIQS